MLLGNIIAQIKENNEFQLRFDLYSKNQNITERI